MALSDMHRSALARLKGQEASLRKELNRHESDQAKALEEERQKMASAARTSSTSSAKSYLSAAERARKKAIDAGKKAAAVTQKLSQNSREQANKTRSLQSAERSEQQALDREADRRRQKEKAHAREIARLSAPQVHYVHIKPPEPERLRVVYMTANPQGDLRTETEVRQVQQALRGAKFRDLVHIELRPAATFQDLLDSLNDVRPHIIHFSGHGGSEAIQFDDGNLTTPVGAAIDFQLLAEALAATDHPPTLLILNACDTLEGLEALLPAVPVMIAMSDSIPDLAAIVFAQQFYAAIASGQSVGSALSQGKVKIKEVLVDDDVAALPQHLSRDDLDIQNLVLVQPTPSGGDT